MIAFEQNACFFGDQKGPCFLDFNPHILSPKSAANYRYLER